MKYHDYDECPALHPFEECLNGLSPAKNQITSPSLSSSHEGDAESVSGEECGNCHKHHYGKDYCPTLPKYEDQPLLEWEIGFAAMYNRLSVVFSLDELHQVKDFIRAERQKEYERGSEEGGTKCCVNCRESLNDNYCCLPSCKCHIPDIFFPTNILDKVRNDTLDEAILIIDGEFLYENKGRAVRERILKRLKANRDI